MPNYSTKLPVIFVSHGAPTLPLENGPTTEFFKSLGDQFPKPAAIVCVSAHWTTERAAVSTTGQNQTIHDFYGFPRELYDIQYPAPGKPELAERVGSLLNAAGMAVDIDPQRGLDHGAWVPLSMMYPAADIPVFQLAVQPTESTNTISKWAALLANYGMIMCSFLLAAALPTICVISWANRRVQEGLITL